MCCCGVLLCGPSSGAWRYDTVVVHRSLDAFRSRCRGELDLVIESLAQEWLRSDFRTVASVGNPLGAAALSDCASSALEATKLLVSL